MYNQDLPISLNKKKMRAEIKQMKSSVQTTQGLYPKQSTNPYQNKSISPFNNGQ